MIATLALGALLLGQTAGQGYFKQVVKSPTGKNGFEEMVLAGDLLRQGGFGIYLRLSDVPAGQIEESKFSPPEAAVWNAFRSLTLLQRRRAIVKKFTPVLDLLERASQKDIYDPRKDMDFNTLLPEQSGFKDVAKLLPVAVYVAFADGQGQRGVQLLTTGLDVFDRLSRGLLIQYLVGVASSNILLPCVEEHLPRMSQKDAVRLEQASLALIEREPAVRYSIELELSLVPTIIRKTMAEFKPEDVDMMIGFAEETDREKALKTLKGMTPAERGRVAEGVSSRVVEVQKEARTALAGTEADWVAFKPDDPMKADWSNANGLIDAIASSALPSYAAVARAAAISRTRLRLLGLACGVLRHRWEHGQLPIRLEDAVGKERAVDPLSREAFELRKDVSGNFSIFSKGTKETGEIGLRYKRPAGEAVEPPNGATGADR